MEKEGSYAAWNFLISEGIDFALMLNGLIYTIS